MVIDDRKLIIHPKCHHIIHEQRKWKATIVIGSHNCVEDKHTHTQRYKKAVNYQESQNPPQMAPNLFLHPGNRLHVCVCEMSSFVLITTQPKVTPFSPFSLYKVQSQLMN